MSKDSWLRGRKGGWRHQFGRVRRAVGRRLSGRKPHLPSEVFPDDIYLVSYPRSGNTWTRMLVGNYLTQGQCSPEQLTYVVPDIHVDPSYCDDVPRPRFIKSHVSFVPEYGRVIYLVRDGRDVAVSYYFYALRQQMIAAETPFDEYLKRFNDGKVPFGVWNDHVVSWLDGAGDDLLPVRYEDIKADPSRWLLRMVEFAGIDPDENRAALAVEHSTMDVWRKAEKVSGSILAIPEGSAEISFARSGAVQQYVEHFDQIQMKEFSAVHGSALRRLGYES